MIKSIRLRSQQLSRPAFDRPEEAVSWMGAVQAQHHAMSKWAVGIRLKAGGGEAVERALREGKILRTHVMRPTWHLVAAEDLRWMLKLSASRIRAANDSLARTHGLELTERFYARCNRLLEDMLRGHKSLTRQEIAQELERAGIPADAPRMTRLLMRAETEGIVCSGVDRDGTHTYALLEERVTPARELHREEALARLAEKYFRSHSPATLSDFVWWSGLPLTEARRAIGSLGARLVSLRFGVRELLVHESWKGTDNAAGHEVHFLPPYDEYLLGYKDRSDVLASEFRARAFNAWGVFYPVVSYGGRIVGN